MYVSHDRSKTLIRRSNATADRAVRAKDVSEAFQSMVRRRRVRDIEIARARMARQTAATRTQARRG